MENTKIKFNNYNNCENEMLNRNFYVEDIKSISYKSNFVDLPQEKNQPKYIIKKDSNVFSENTIDSEKENIFIINIYTVGYKEKGESIYITIESRCKNFFYDILIDCYKTSQNITKILLGKIKRKKGINCICLSHYHDDHILGLDEILKDYSKINTLVLVPDVDCEKSLSANAVEIRKKIADLVKNGKKKNGDVLKVSNPCMILDNNIFTGDKKINFTIIAVSPFSNITMRNANKNPVSVELNDYSISLLVIFGNLKLLFTGDTMDTTLRKMENMNDVNFLKIPHHGSNDSEKMLDLVNICKDTVCVSTNYITSNLPDIKLLNKYTKLTDELYVTQKDSKDDFGIVHTRYEFDIEKNIIAYDVKSLYNSKKYVKEQIWRC